MNTSTLTPNAKRRALIGVVVSGFLTTLGISLVSFTLPLASLDARVSGAWLGTGMGGFFLARMIAGPLGGRWADKVGARFPLLVGAGAGAFVPLLYMMQPTLLMLYGVQFVLGIVSGLVRPVGLAVLGGNGASEKGNQWFSFHVLAFNLALFGGPLVGGFLYWNRTMEPVLIGLALCMVLAHLILFIVIPKDLKLHRSCEEDGATPTSASYRALLVAIFGRSLGIGLVVAFYPLLLSSVTSDPFLIGGLFALPHLVVCVGLLLFQRVTAKFSDVFNGFAGIGMSLCGLFFLPGAESTKDFALLGLLMGLGTAISMPSLMQLVSQYKAGQGQAFGGAHVATGLGMALGPFVGGLILSGTRSLGLAFELIAIAGVVCCLAFVWKRATQLEISQAVVKVGLGCVLVGMLALGITRTTDQVRQTGPVDESLYQYTDVAMGTVVNLTLVADSQKAADDASRKALAFMRTVQKDLDYRDPHGSISRINSAAGLRYVKPTKRAYDLIQRAVDFSQSTGGVFDPTIGALTTSPLYYVLDETIAQSKRQLVDSYKVSFDKEEKRVLLRKKGMALDLGGIAKGAVIDATVKLLRKLHIRAGIVEAGGDFYCFGDRDWTVGIRHPRDKGVYGTVTVREKGVCGSGDYQQFVKYEEDGETNLRHHIINPKEMEPAEVSAGVTVIAESAELADGMATALFIMGPKKGRDFVKAKFPHAAAMWFTPDLSVTTTDNFRQEKRP